jgi:hypothetical protein
MIVTTVASGGLPVVEVAAGKLALPVREGKGVAVTKVSNGMGLPVQWTTVLAGVSYVTWSPTDKAAAITLSNGNLTVNASSSTSCAVRVTSGKTSGKYYFEITCTGTFASEGLGIATATSTLDNGAGLKAYVNILNGIGFVNGGNVGGVLTAGINSGNVCCMAVDLDNKRMWWRKDSQAWTNSGNPATNTGGIDISSIFASVAAYPVATLVDTGCTYAANFGASAFAGAVPSGFTAGWPA